MLGFELMRFEPGVAEIAVPLRDELTNSWGVAHGGVTMRSGASTSGAAQRYATRIPLGA